MRNFILILLNGLIFLSTSVYAQTMSSATLEQCYEWSRNNYPLIQKLDLIEQSAEYNLSNASKGKLPQLSIKGQATIQSDVTQLLIELPGMDIPTLSKDQYKIYGEVYQPLTNFSNVDNRKEQIAIDGQIEQKKVEIDLYRLKDRINQVYFGLLLMGVKDEQLSLVLKDLENTLLKLDGALENGTATLMDKKLLEVEKIAITQELQENESNVEAFLMMLSALTGQNITVETDLVAPLIFVNTPTLNRPELELFGLQSKMVEVQNAQLKNRNRPNIGLFLQGGYGRPGLNFLSNDFEPYYVAGLKLNWNLNFLYTSKSDQKQLEIKRQMIQNQKDVFLLNTEITQSQQSVELSKYRNKIVLDKKAVELREDIKTTAEVQLLNGIITSLDYIKILNDANRASQQLRLDELLFLQAQYKLKTTSGN